MLDAKQDPTHAGDPNTGCFVWNDQLSGLVWVENEPSDAPQVALPLGEQDDH